MSVTTIIDINNPSNFVIDDPLKVEIDPTNGGRLKKYAEFFSNFNVNENAVFGVGNPTGTLGGNAVVSGGELDLTGGNAYCEYNPNNLVNLIGEGCVRVRWKPDYTGNAPAVQEICQTSTNTSNRVHIRHNSNFFQCNIFNSSGSLIFNMSFGWTPSTIKYYEIELNFDCIGGNARVFIDGQLEDSDTGTGTRTGNTLFRLGASGGMNSYIDGIIIFDSVQHTSNYSPTDWTEIPLTLYPTDDPYFSLNVANINIRADQLFDFLEDVSKTGSDDIKYALGRDSEIVYYNTVSEGWETSSLSLLQSNSVAEILLGKETFLNEGYGKTLDIYFIVHSEDGSTTPEIIQVTLETDFVGEDYTPVLTTITGHLSQLDNNVTNKELFVQTFDYVIGTNLITTSDLIPITIYPNKYFEAKLYTEDVEPSGLIWRFRHKYNYLNEKIIKTDFLPGNIKFSDLTIQT